MSIRESAPILPPLPADVLAGRVPKWRLDRLTHRVCPSCRGDRPEPVCCRPDGLEVAACAGCGMRYLAEVPGPEDLDAFYRDYAAYKRILRPRVSLAFRLSPIKPADPYVEILRATGGIAGERLCEVGCSFGAFLRKARAAGAQVSGVELDEAALRELQAAGIPASRRLEPGRTFDVMCAFQLLEHLSNPESFAAEVADALRDDGRLLLAMPNGDDGARVGPGWVGYRVDLEHLNYFGVGTLAPLLRRHGLLIEHYWEVLQANLPRGNRESMPTRRPLELLRAWLAEGGGTIRPRDGQFMLVVLARKVAGSGA
jgi:2-polyprenyl-3-methyl-5-hydroxy-6-metoxy-1,4-benzoquinol methylase